MATINKTLVIRFSSIGDIVLSSPLLRILRARFPDGQIDYVTRKEYAELVRSNQNLNYTYEFDAAKGFEGLRVLKRHIRSEGYDLILDIHDSLRSKYLRSIRGPSLVAVVNKRVVERTMLVKLKKNVYKGVVSVADRYVEPLGQLGIVGDGKGLELHIPDEVLFGVSSKMSKLQLNRFEKVIGLCPGARHFTKRWPAERFAELGARCAREVEAKLLIFGGAEEVDLCTTLVDDINKQAGSERATHFCGTLSLLETAAAMNVCDVIITNDSGLMHIATAVQRNVVAIFGSTVKEFGFFPYKGNAVVLERPGLYCRPCSHIGRSECPEDHFRCMREIGTEEVYAAARRMLAPGDSAAGGIN
jgi:lipopolysaccharide heptosyltransferase II